MASAGVPLSPPDHREGVIPVVGPFLVTTALVVSGAMLLSTVAPMPAFARSSRPAGGVTIVTDPVQATETSDGAGVTTRFRSAVHLSGWWGNACPQYLYATTVDGSARSDGTFDEGTFDYDPWGMSDPIVFDAADPWNAMETLYQPAIAVVGDWRDEDDETFTIHLRWDLVEPDDEDQCTQVVSGYDTADLVFTIHDDDATLSIADAQQTEGTAPDPARILRLTASLSEPVAYDVILLPDEDLSAGTATYWHDWRRIPGYPVIAAGELTAKVRYELVGDAEDEPDETIRVLVSGVTGIGYPIDVGRGAATGTILDDDAPAMTTLRLCSVWMEADGHTTQDCTPLPAGTVGEASVVEGTPPDAGPELRLPLKLSEPLAKDLSVTVTTVARSATAGTDFQLPPATVVIPAGARSAKVIIPIVADRLDEPDETFTIAIAAAGVNETRAKVEVAIVDDDPRPKVSVLQAVVREGSGPMVVPIRLSTESGRDVSVRYRTVAGTAGIPDDVTGVDKRVKIVAGGRQNEVRVPIVLDTRREWLEHLDLRIADPVGARLSHAAACGWVFDADVAPVELGAADVTMSGGWDRQAGLPCALGGTTWRSSARGDTLTLTAEVRGFALVGVTGPDRGRADVRIDGGTATRIDLYTRSPGPGTVVFRRTLPAGLHTIEVTVLGRHADVSDGSLVELDAILVREPTG